MKTYKTDKMAARYCKNSIAEIISKNESALICLAAGHTSLPVFEQLISDYKEGKISFAEVKIVGLDEWAGLSGNDDGSCENFLRVNLFNHINLKPENIRLFNGKAKDLQKECDDIDLFIKENGGIDYMLLGVGMNGHLGLNEPGTDENNYSHIVKLDMVTQDVADKYFKEKPVLTNGITMGIKNILETRKVQVLISGKKKSSIVKKIVEADRTNSIPATLIKNNKNVEFIIDKEASGLLENEEEVMKKTKVAILGCGFIANIHMESYERFVPDAEVVAVYGRNAEKVKIFAEQYGIESYYDDLDVMLKKSDCEVVDICIPNYVHYDACMKAAKSGRHVIVEKPIALTLEQADEMIAACKETGTKLMYAEELCFAPKYERVRMLVEHGAFGKLYMIKQAEKHSGPHSRWFYEAEYAGGGVMMDMGCHALAWFRWILGGNPKVKSVYASMSTVMHDTDCEDNTVTLVEFEDDVLAVAEDSWAKHGGMDDRIEVYGDKGVSYADLFRGNSALTYSEDGYDYAMEKAGSSQGWTFTVYEETFNQGYPQELAHFIDCVRNDLEPKVTGEDGRAVLEIIYAAYESARTGKKVNLPFEPKVSKPIDLWHK